MINQTVKYKDYNGNEKTKDLYFDLDKFEIMQLERSYPGGFSNHIRALNESGDTFELAAAYIDLVIRSYGEKSEDGEVFLKSQEMAERFIHTAAFDALFDKLTSDTKLAETFIKGIIPADMVN